MRKKILKILLFVIILTAIEFLGGNSYATQEIIATEENSGVEAILLYDYELKEVTFTIKNKSLANGTVVYFDCDVLGMVEYGGYYLIDTNEEYIYTDTMGGDDDVTYCFNSFNVETFSEDKQISEIIMNIDEPYYNGNVDREVSCDTIGIESVNVNWYDSKGKLYSEEKFSNDTYRAEFSFTLSNGYTMKCNSAQGYNGSIKINGKNVSTSNTSIYYKGFSFRNEYIVEKKLKYEIDLENSYVVNKELTTGDDLIIKLKVDSNIDIDYIDVCYTKPVTQVRFNEMRFTKNSSTGLFEYSTTVADNWQNGTWMIDYIYMRDILGEGVFIYNNANPHSFNNEGSINFSNLDFNVSGTNADQTKPTISAETTKASSNKAIAGDTVKISVKITDDREIKKASIRYKYGNNWDDYREISLYYNSKTELYEGNITFDSSDVVGEWTLYYIYAIDYNDNYNYIYSYANAWDKEKVKIYNFGVAPSSNFSQDNYSIDKTQVKAEDSVNISIEAGNVFGIDSVKYYYKIGDKENPYIVNANFDKENGKNYIHGLEYSLNNYIGTIDIGEYGENGKWTLNKIEIKSLKGNLTTIYNSELNGDIDESMDLSSLDFNVEGLKQDEEKPIIDSYTISNKDLFYNGKTKVSIITHDELSEIRSVKVNYTYPNGTSEDIELALNDDKYECEFIFDNHNKEGLYQANYISVEDGSGNIETLNLQGQLSFNFKPSIAIISPSKYLDTTYSCQLKAIILDPNADYSGVTWVSSNTSIASINSSTGMLSTKYTNGEVRIYAEAIDNSGIYGYIDLVVTSSSVQVGETISLGNSNPVGYSSVIWEIEDESILGKTGRTGRTSINNRYYHTITVEGLKEGTTNLIMCMPSGEEISTTTVYVYDAPKTISSAINEITLFDDESIRIEDVSVTTTSGNEYTNGIYFYSENESIAKVDQEGLVTAVGGGKTNIIVCLPNSSKKLVIPTTVTIYTNSIEVDKEEVILNEENDSYQIGYNVNPSNASDLGVTFESGNNNVAKVSSSGLITAVKNGSTTITIKSNDGKSSKTIDVIVEDFVQDINNITIEEISDTYYNGSELKPNVILKDNNYTLIENLDYTIECSNNINVGKGTIIIKGIGDYKNSITKEFNIGKGKIIDSSTGCDVRYDGKEHSVNIVLNVDDYDISYSYKSENYNYYFVDNYTPIIEETNVNEKPKFVQPGIYYISYHVTKDNYEPIDGTLIVRINGVSAFNPDLVRKLNDIIIINRSVTSYNNLQFNFIERESATYRHYNKNKEEINTEKMATGDYFGLETDNSNYTYYYQIAVLGDVNGDGEITEQDYKEIGAHILGKKEISEEASRLAADVIADNYISVLDYFSVCFQADVEDIRRRYSM